MNQENAYAIAAFFVLLLATIFAGRAEAAISLAPSVPGLSGGMLSTPSGSVVMTAANDGYIKPSVVNVGGKPITVPATMRLAANAGNYAKNMMRLNPTVLVGTLAVGVLLDYGLEYLDSEWKMNTDPSTLPGSIPVEDEPSNWSVTPNPSTPQAQAAWIPTANAIEVRQRVVTIPDGWSNAGCDSYWGYCVARKQFYVPRCGYVVSPDYGCASASTRPATDDDWAALPDLLPVVAPELPYAPYMPEGVPVDPPEYDFVPFTTPVGNPYTKPDGSTAQPMASLSPNGDQVTIDTFEQPLTDPNGDPVANSQPQDTQEPTPNPCQQNPSSLACAEFGVAPPMEAIPVTVLPASTSFTPIGGAGQCPADITTTRFGITWSYQPICDFAQAIKPFILGFTWIAFAYIVAGAVRT